MQHPKHLIWFWIVPLLIILSAFALSRLDADGYWFDEWWSMYNSGHPYYGAYTSPDQVWAHIAEKDHISSPGYYITLWGWAQVAGWSEFATRFLSFICGILTVPLTYRLAWRMSRHRLVAIGAMVAVGSNAYFLFYLHEIRHYTPLVLMAVWSADSYWALLHAQRGKLFYGISLFLSCAGLLYVQNLGIAMLGVLGITHLYLLLQRGLTRLWLMITAVMIGGAATFIPWLTLTLDAVSHKQGHEAQRLGFNDIAQMWIDSVNFFSNQLGGIILLIMMMLLITRKKMPALVWIWLGMSFITLTILVLWLAVPTNRYTIITFPAIALLFGYGVHHLAGDNMAHRRMIGGTLIGGMALAGIFFAVHPQYESLMYRDVHWREPTREFVQSLIGRTSPQDALIFHPQEMSQVANVLPFYLTHYGVVGVPALVDTWQRPTQAQYIAQAERIIGGHTLLWVGISQPPARQAELFDYLLQERGFSACGMIHQGADLHVSAYITMPEEAIHFGDGINIAPTGIFALHNDVLTFPLAIQIADDVPRGVYSVAVHVDGIHPTMEQFDFSLPFNAQNCQWVSIDMSRLMPDDFTLWVMVYNWQTWERLPVSHPDALDGRVPIGVVSK